MKLHALTCDPGFGNFGWAIVAWDSESRSNTLCDMGVITTKKAKKKQRVLATEDNFARLREIATKLHGLVLEHDVRVVSFEAFSMPMKANKSNLTKIGMPYGALAMLATARDVAVVMLTPQAIKKELCGKISASKEEVRTEVLRVLAAPRHQPVLKIFDKQTPKAQHEHGYDALAVYLAAQNSEVMRALRGGAG